MKKDDALMLVVILVAGALIFGGDLKALVGQTVMSMTKAEVRSSHPDFSGELFVVTGAQQGLGQIVEGTFRAEDVGAMAGVYPEKDFQVLLDFDKQTCQYDLQVNPTANDIFIYSIVQYPRDLLFNFDCSDLTAALAACPHEVFYGVTSLFSDKCICIEKTQSSSGIADIDNPIVRTRTTIQVSNGDQIFSLPIDTSAQISGWVDPGKNVFVTWDGYLTKDVCTSQSPYFAYFGGIGNPYHPNGIVRIGSAYNYDKYIATEKASMSYAAMSACNGNYDCIEQNVKAVNEAATDALLNQNFGSMLNSYSLDSALIEVSLTELAEIPVYTFYIDADYLGIFQPYPDPRIVDVQTETFKTGEHGYLYVVIQNVGKELGNIQVWAECELPFQYSDSTKILSLNPDETKAVNLEISAATEEPITKYCTVFARALDREVSKKIQVSVDPRPLCTPFDQACKHPNDRHECSAEGTTWIHLQDCSLLDAVCTYTKTTIPRVTECVEKIIPDDKPENNLLLFVIGVILFLILVVLILKAVF